MVITDRDWLHQKEEEFVHSSNSLGFKNFRALNQLDDLCHLAIDASDLFTDLKGEPQLTKNVKPNNENLLAASVYKWIFQDSPSYKICKPIVWDIATLHGIPKIHKKPLPLMRPIIAQNDTIFTQAHLWLNSILKQLREELYIRAPQECVFFIDGASIDLSDDDKINKRNKFRYALPKLRAALKKFKKRHPNKEFAVFSADFRSMYDEIRHDLAVGTIQTIMKALNRTELVGKVTYQPLTTGKYKYANKRIRDYPITKEKGFDLNMVIDLANRLISNNIFKWNGTLYQQNCGIPMGAISSPTVADLALWHAEVKISQDPICAEWSVGFCRYLDDFCAILPVDKMKQISNRITELYRYNTYLELIPNADTHFLDLDISISGAQLNSKLYRKELNSYDFPNYLSYIPNSVLKGVIIGEYKRIHRNCTNVSEADKEFLKFTNILSTYKNFPIRFIQSVIDRMHNKKEKTGIKGIPIVLDFTDGIRIPKTVKIHEKTYPLAQVHRMRPPLNQKLNKIVGSEDNNLHPEYLDIDHTLEAQLGLTEAHDSGPSFFG